MRERRRWRFDAFLGCDFQRSLESQLDLARCFLTGGSVRHDPAPFNDLGDEAFVAFLRRIPNADFIISGIRLHQCFSSWFEIQFLQLVPYLPYLIRFRLSAGAGLQIQEARPSVKNDMAAFRLARIVTELRQKRAQIVKRKVRITSSGHELFKQFFCFAHALPILAAGPHWRQGSRTNETNLLDANLTFESLLYRKPLMMENWRALLLFKKTHGVTREQTVALRHGSLDAIA